MTGNSKTPKGELGRVDTETATVNGMSWDEFEAELRRPIPWWKARYYSLWRAWKHHVRTWPRVAREFVHRGRHGWAQSDTWSLDHYLARVMGESLACLADNVHGWPGEQSEWPEPEQWEAELRKHAAVFKTYATNWTLDREAEIASHEATAQSLARIATFWGHLWD